jgi:hypothetical protein
MHFPQLQELVLLDWDSEEFLEIGGVILAHQNYLNLKSDDNLGDITFTVTMLGSGGFPTVAVKLQGNPNFLSDMFTRYPAKIRQSLQTLAIRPMPIEDERLSRTTNRLNKLLDEMNGDFNELPLTTLRSIDLAFTSPPEIITIRWDLIDPDIFLTQIRRLIELAPDTIETFPRAIPPIPGLTPQKVAATFSRAAKIKSIHLSEKLVELFGCAEDWSMILACSCLALENVFVEASEKWSRKVRSFPILRNYPGSTISIGKVEEYQCLV